MSSFQPQHLPNVEPERVIWILLEILADIPEEVNDGNVNTKTVSYVLNLVSEYNFGKWT